MTMRPFQVLLAFLFALTGFAQDDHTYVLIHFDHALNDHQKKVTVEEVAAAVPGAVPSLDEPATRLKLTHTTTIPVESVVEHLHAQGIPVNGVVSQAHGETNTWVTVVADDGDRMLLPWASLSDEQRIAVRTRLTSTDGPTRIDWLHE